jgi:hypothetical protein
MKIKILTLSLLTMLSACSSSPEKTSKANLLSDLPDWILSPNIDNGIADVACVESSGAFSIDRSEAIHYGSEQLAAQLNRKVASLGKGFQSKTKTNKGINVGSNFTQTGQQLIEQELTGVKAHKIGIFEIDNKKQLCVLVGISPEQTKSIYQNLKQNSNADLSAQDDTVLFQEFKAYKAQQDLDKKLIK